VYIAFDIADCASLIDITLVVSRNCGTYVNLKCYTGKNLIALSGRFNQYVY